MIDARECAEMARQVLEEAHEARVEAARCSTAGQKAKSERWTKAADALTGAAEHFQKAADEIEAVGRC